MTRQYTHPSPAVDGLKPGMGFFSTGGARGLGFSLQWWLQCDPQQGQS